MGFSLGVDLGTTFTAAAVCRDGKVEMVGLGNRSAVIPSVLFVRSDGGVLAGEAASRRSVTEPGSIAREFKRRLGDPTPLLVNGAPHSAESLMAKLLRSVYDVVVAREDGAPALTAVTHPANWGPYKKELLGQALRMADVGPTALLTEPEAAALYYASQERVDPGAVIAVYDLGGGTFDVAVLRKHADGFEVLGQPEGIDRLGGIDFDAAVFAHLDRTLDGQLSELPADDPATIAGMARLRADCVEAKEALSTDSDTSIPILLPTLTTEVRLTRGEFEAMIRPTLLDTVEAMRRALRSAEISPAEVTAVLLAGGSSRAPLVAQLLGAELHRPVAVDAHPKHAVALGAALFAAGHAELAPRAGAASGAPPAAPNLSVRVVSPSTGEAEAALDPAPAEAAQPADAALDPASDPQLTPAPAEVGAPARARRLALAGADSGRAGAGAAAPPAPGLPAPAERGGRGRLAALGVGAAAVVLLGAFALLQGRGDDGEDAAALSSPAGAAAAAPVAAPTTAVATTAVATTAAPTTAAPTTAAPTTVAEPCAGATPPFVCITGVEVRGEDIVAPFTPIGFQAVAGEAASARHIHFYFPYKSIAGGGDKVLNAGASGPNPFDWRHWDRPNLFGPGGSFPHYTVADARAAVAGGAKELCAVMADNKHNALPGTGNCIPLPPELLTR